MIPSPPADAIARLRDATPPFEGAIGVAVSGGPDSLAMLLLAAAAWPGRTIAATVDHGLRPESAVEAVHVAAICARLGVPHEILIPDTPITGSLQDAARRARYALLEAWRARRGAAWVLTAHHADDQVETLLMRLNRGAGLGGLAGVRRVNRHVLRPLIDWRRAELGAIVESAGLGAVDDPSNRDPRFDRARLRGAIAGADWLDPAAFVRSASHLADAEQAIEWMTARLAVERIAVEANQVTLDPAGLPPMLVRRLTLVALARVDPGARPSGPALDRLLESLGAGRQTSMGAALCRGGATWRFVAAPPRRAGN